MARRTPRRPGDRPERDGHAAGRTTHPGVRGAASRRRPERPPVIGRLRSDLRQGLELARPATLATFWRAGAFDIRGAIGLATSWPWLLGRGASLGVMSQLNRVALSAKTALIDRNGELTWGELDRRVNRLFHGFGAMGIEPGDRVALLLRKGREMVEALFACQKSGIVAAPLNTWAKPKELAATLQQADPRVLIYDVLHAELATKAVGLELIAVGDPVGALEGSRVYEELLDQQLDWPTFP